MEEYLKVSINGGIPNGLFVRDNPTQMDENWAYPYFRKPPNPHLNNLKSRHVQSFINIPGFYLRRCHALQKSIHIPRTGQFPIETSRKPFQKTTDPAPTCFSKSKMGLAAFSAPRNLAGAKRRE